MSKAFFLGLFRGHSQGQEVQGVCDSRSLIKEFDWDLVLISLLLGFENV